MSGSVCTLFWTTSRTTLAFPDPTFFVLFLLLSLPFIMVIEISRDRHDHGCTAGEPQRLTMTTKNAYTVREQPLGSARHIRIVGIGAGASGLNMIRTLRLNLTDYEVVVYEKNADVGGTWFENRYPGCRCDIPSHNYQFSWRPKHDWSNFFASAAEIGEYLRQICDDEGMREVIKTSHQIVSASWSELEGLWRLVVRDLEMDEEFTDYAHFLVDGSGVLKYVACRCCSNSYCKHPVVTSGFTDC